MIDRVLGIDPSWDCTGVATVGPDGMRMQRLPAGDLGSGSVEDDLNHIGIMVTRVLRHLDTWIHPGEQVLAVFEGPAMGAKYGRPDERAAIRWMIANQLRLARGARLAYVPPATVKKFWTGDGSAKKDKMVGYTEARYPRLAIPDHNANDGFALAMMGAVKLGITRVPGPPMVYLPSLKAGRWPSDLQEAHSHG